MKAGMLVWVVGFFPLGLVFDTYDACYEVEKSFKRIVDAKGSTTPERIFIRGYQAVVDYTPCISWKSE